MRVLQIVGSLGRGGAETMVMNYYRELVKRDVQFDFVVHADAVNGYEDEARSLGANIIRLPRPGQVGAFKYINALKKAIKENGPYDAVHAHTDVQCFMCAIAARLAGVKRVITHSHNTHFKKCGVEVNRFVVGICRTARLACGDEAGKAFYGKKSFDVLQNAMRIEKYACVSRAEIEEEKKRLGLEGKFIITHVGRFVRQKNHMFLLHMMAPVLKQNENAILCLVGGGELREKAEALCQELGIKEHVKFLGVVNNTHVIYNMSDLVVLPSLYEGLPLTVIESQAAGRMMLCSDVVTRECDMGLGLVNFIPLDEKLWQEEIGKYLQVQIVPEVPSLEERKEKLASFDITQQCEKLMKIYGAIK